LALQGNERALGAPWADGTRRWIERAANAIALAVNGAACLLELDGVIIDGAVSRALLNALVDAVRQAMERYNWQGVLRPDLHVGTIGPEAKVTGAAYLPLHATFAPAHHLFLRFNRR
jgi:predicted NBD/HSP70 family sugar kinase